jgi:hypothetical protein
MDFIINGKEICRSTVTYGGPGFEKVQSDGTVWKSMAQTYACPDVVRVKKGDRLQMSAHFDFDAHKA